MGRFVAPFQTSWLAFGAHLRPQEGFPRIRVLEVVREQCRVDLVDGPFLERGVVILLACVQVLSVG